MPPTRFRVVERGRRLEVIDTASGEVVGNRSRRSSGDGASRREAPLLLEEIVGQSVSRKEASAKQPGWLPRATRFDGTVGFTTHTFYDNRAPRTVMLDPTRATMLRWSALGIILLLLLTPALLLMLAWSSLPLLFAIGAIVFNPKVRERLRAGTTALIDRFADPA